VRVTFDRMQTPGHVALPRLGWRSPAAALVVACTVTDSSPYVWPGRNPDRTLRRH